MKPVKYTPQNVMLELRKTNSIELCLNSSTPSLALLKKENGEQSVCLLIETWILDLNEFLNVSRKMNESQIKQTAQMILADFYYFKIADINLVFQNAKKGLYGALYESLDGMKIYQWFEKYAIDRSELAYQTAIDKHKEVKNKDNSRDK